MASLVNQASATIIQPALAVLLTVWQGLMTGIQNAWTAYGQPLLDGVARGLPATWRACFQTALWHGTVIQPVLAGLVAHPGRRCGPAALDPLWQQLTLALGAVGEPGAGAVEQRILAPLASTGWSACLGPGVQPGVPRP